MSAAELPRAAAKGDLRAVKRLLQAGVPPNTKGAHGNTGLHLAAAGGHAAVVRALLEGKASPDVHAADGCTPLVSRVVEGGWRRSGEAREASAALPAQAARSALHCPGAQPIFAPPILLFGLPPPTPSAAPRGGGGAGRGVHGAAGGRRCC